MKKLIIAIVFGQRARGKLYLSHHLKQHIQNIDQTLNNGLRTIILEVSMVIEDLFITNRNM
jgi:hypothetical protein